MNNHYKIKKIIPKSFAIYYLDSNKTINYLRFKTIQNKDESLRMAVSFVKKFKDASKFINIESVKNTIQSLQSKYSSYNFKYIDSSKI